MRTSAEVVDEKLEEARLRCRWATIATYIDQHGFTKNIVDTRFAKNGHFLAYIPS